METQVEESENEIRAEILNHLGKYGASSRAQIVNALGRPRTTLYDNLAALINKEIVKKFPRQVNPRGRPVVFFKLKSE
jgi:predicted ArsR family transcriptional regulator